MTITSIQLLTPFITSARLGLRRIHFRYLMSSLLVNDFAVAHEKLALDMPRLRCSMKPSDSDDIASERAPNKLPS